MFRGQGHSDPKMIRDTLPSQDASTHQIWNSKLKEYGRYPLGCLRFVIVVFPDHTHLLFLMPILETRSEVNITVTQGWYATHWGFLPQII